MTGSGTRARRVIVAGATVVVAVTLLHGPAGAVERPVPGDDKTDTTDVTEDTDTTGTTVPKPPAEPNNVPEGVDEDPTAVPDGENVVDQNSAPAEDDDGVPVAVAAILAAAAAAVGAVVAWLLARSARRGAGEAPAESASPALLGQRAAMVVALIELRDLIESEALRDRIGSALAGVGVVEVRADGERFDATRHQAVDSMRTNDASRHDTVAETERPGYRDGNDVLRLPAVAVWRYDGTGVPR